MKYFVVFMYFVIVGYVFAERKLPTYIKPCHRFAPDLSNCWMNTFIKLKPYLAKGIPEFDIPPITEFRIEQLHLDQGNTPNINFIADLYNVTFRGGENVMIPYTNLDFKALTIEEGLIFPKLVMKGDYKAKGKVLVFDFEGEGEVKGQFDDVKINGTWKWKIIKKKMKDHIQIDTTDLQVYPGKMWIHFNNLFRGSEEITESINNAINENTDILYNDFKPVLQTTLSSVFSQYINRVYGLYPLDVLLPID
ncbi:hypothetical protein Trydic_g12937 [Trypoxylus dichotomus]